MAQIRNLKDNGGNVFYPLTHERAVKDSNGVSLESKLAGLESKSYIETWDGASTPVVANIPEGVTVTYNTTTYTGTLEASASTIGKIYMVKNGSNYDRYITSQNGDSYSWSEIGSTEMDLSGYATDEDLGLLEGLLNQFGGYLVPLLKKVVYEDNDAESLIESIDVLLNTDLLISISANYTQSGEIYSGESLDDLREDLVVTANYASGRSVEMSNYVLSGQLSAGTSSITVTFQEMTASFNVLVTAAEYYKDGSLFPVQVALRNEISTTAGLQTSYVKDGVTYVFANSYANGGNATTQKRSCYYLFDLLLTPGKQYKYIIEFNSLPAASQTIQWSVGYYDETYRVAGVANAYQTQNYSNNQQASSWATGTMDGNKISFVDTVPTGYVGVRITLRCMASGSDVAWPTSLSIKRLIIQDVTE